MRDYLNVNFKYEYKTSEKYLKYRECLNSIMIKSIELIKILEIHNYKKINKELDHIYINKEYIYDDFDNIDSYITKKHI